jgi:hypothetical protein
VFMMHPMKKYCFRFIICVCVIIKTMNQGHTILTRWTFDPNHELQYDEQWDNLHTLGPLCTTFSKYKISMKTKTILTKLRMVLVSKLVLGF